MSAHSAGPWSIDADGCIFADGVCIGSIIPTNRAGNGALIIAAPDMYEALKAASQFIRNGIECGYIQMPDRDTPDSAHDTLPMIDASLAKAVAK